MPSWTTPSARMLRIGGRGNGGVEDEHEGDAHCGREEMAEQDAAHAALLVGVAGDDIHAGHREAGEDRDEVAQQVAGRELVEEE